MRAAILNEENLVVNTVLADEETAAQNGWILSDVASIGDTYDPETGEFTSPEPPPPPPQSDEEKRAGIIAERARRLEAGFTFDFGDERGEHYIQTREIDKEGWDAVDRWAAAMSGLGDTASTLLILTGTGPVSVTAPEWHSIVAHGAAAQQPIWQASFALRAMDPIPDDYTDDRWWP